MPAVLPDLAPIALGAGALLLIAVLARALGRVEARKEQSEADASAAAKELDAYKAARGGFAERARRRLRDLSKGE